MKRLIVILGSVAICLFCMVFFCDSRDALAEKAKSYTIGVSFASSTHPFYVMMKEGVDEMAKKLNVKLNYVQTENDVMAQLNGIQDLIALEVDALLVSPVDTEGAVPAYVQAKNANIPIFSIARAVDPKYQDGFIGADWRVYGIQIAKWIMDQINGKGDIILIKGLAGAYHTMQMEDGLKEVVSKFPDVNIVAETYTRVTQEDAARVASDFLSAHPNVEAIYTSEDEIALGVLPVLRERGLAGKIILTGFDGRDTAVDAIKNGEMHYTIALRPKSWGALGLKTVVEHLEGVKHPPLVPIEVLAITPANAKLIKASDLE